MQEYNIIHTINLEHRTDRLEGFLKESLLQGFGVKVWPGIIIKHNNKKAITLAHKQIIQYAKDNYLPNVVVAEDDCRFMAPGAWKYFIENMPTDFDIYLSMYYVCDTVIGNRIASVFSGMTMYMVNSRFYDTFLLLDDDGHIDRDVLGKVANQYKFLFCDQVVAEQCAGKSDNTHTSIPTYRPYLKGRKIFGDVKID